MSNGADLPSGSPTDADPVPAPAVGRGAGNLLSACAAVPPPRFFASACASERAGVFGCRACAEVCPHGALRFTTSGPQH
ncbi:MAG: 4Fe-4S binding protein [Planctomycetota bacterium]